MLPDTNARLLPKGCVYGTLLNFRGTLAALGSLDAPPYNAPPRAPILYIRPANTWSRSGATIVLPDGAAAIEVGATFGIVMARAAVRVPARYAREYIAGFVVVNDVCLPHLNFYRPAIRERCRDGFCVIGSELVGPDTIADPGSITIRAYVNGVLRQEASARDLIRSVPQLIADICEFMTLMPGDILLAGVPADPPLARAGDAIRVEAEGLGHIENRVVAESSQTTDVAAG